MPKVKRALSASSSPSPSKAASTSPAQVTPKKAKASTKAASASPHTSRGRPGPKARISPENKAIIATEIIRLGTAALDVDLMAARTGLSSQQIRSQIVDNRQNLRKQLSDMANALGTTQQQSSPIWHRSAGQD